ncbi:PBP1A family penicillin-binding protein [Flavobacterium agricola]|uniref:PBP1A family penicillin-binding protein n=1 Tax=Flavobacterium agricola TaxID=2870839 RepID=A0ABY6LZG0_9FLAO|nr:PBP1A family penicillin-binding protein [Flavobacterium agricola]UYW00942.1 PBP1A family penicillin-binding protein [Flavobacterium agricola]
MTKNTKKTKDKSFKGLVAKFWLVFLAGIAAIFLFFLLASWGVFGAMPTFDQLENPNSNQATEIYSDDNKVIGKFYLENRVNVKFDDLPPHLVNALVATEDERFYTHSGIDARGTLRAVSTLGQSGGASTISQQLAKLLFHGEGDKNIIKRVAQKVKEWIIATKLERQYTKQEIIAMYLNRADFVNNAVGIRSAAQVYLGKNLEDISIDEAAMFVGMLKNPALFNPNRRPEKVLERRNVVLNQMVKNGYLTKDQAETEKQKPLSLNFRVESHNEGNATYFREYLREELSQWVKNNKKADGTHYDIYRDGLKIYTTVDSRMQQYAEEAVVQHLSNLQEQFFIEQANNKMAPFNKVTQAEVDRIMERSMRNSDRWKQMAQKGIPEEKIRASFLVKTPMRVFAWEKNFADGNFDLAKMKNYKDTIMTPLDSIRYHKHFLQTGLMAMDPTTGNVKAWVGGIDYKHFQYDHVGQGARQVGSVFKPFVYAAAFEQKELSPCDSILDAPFTMPKGKWGIEKAWSPTNASRTHKGMMTYKYALANSINTVSAKLMDMIGPNEVIDLTRQLGVTTDIPAQPAIALGAVDITVNEMVGAFSTFANKGVHIKPRIIDRIVDKNGVVIYRNTPEINEVMSEEKAYVILKLLEGVTESGTGTRLRYGTGGPAYKRVTGLPYKFTNKIAGKTGTSQNNSDGWFIGMVPNLATGIWVGNDDRAANFKKTTYGQGATMALPIWGLFMQKCYADPTLNVSKGEFERPRIVRTKIDCSVPVVTASDSTSVVPASSTNEFDF